MPTVNYGFLGSSDLRVSELGLGCARLGGIFHSGPRSDMVATLRLAVDKGITFFDTADMYCQGESEEILGDALHDMRHSIVIASKVGYRLPAQRIAIARIKPLVKPLIQRMGIKRQHLPPGIRGSLSQDFSAGYITQAAEHSLKRLKTDYLDLYQLHSPPASILEAGDFLAPLEKLKSQGKIRYFGVSCETAADALICLRYPEISSLQIRINLIDQTSLSTAAPQAALAGCMLIARECYAGGILASPIQESTSKEAIPLTSEREERLRDLARLQLIADGLGRPLTQVALQFVLSMKLFTVTLLGVRTSEHLITNLEYLASPPLTQDEIQTLRH